MKLQKILKNLPLVFIFLNTSGQILAKNRIDIDADKVTFDVEHNQNQYSSHQSDLKIGQFNLAKTLG
ncbi:hypothetical protein ACWIW6_06690 [Ursidibacter sp. B-7004-1]